MKWKVTALILFVLIVLPVVAYIALNPEKNVLDEATRNHLGGTYIKLSHGMTHYKLSGPENGKVVVLVHGGTIPIWTWDSLAPELSAAGFRVLSYDAYGRGYSDRPDVRYDQILYRHQLKELAEQLNLTQPFDLIGLSVGGGIAVNFTAQYPEKIHKLILISPLISNFKVPSLFSIPVFGEFIARIAGINVILKRFRALVQDHPKADKFTALFKEQTTYKGFQQSILSMLRNNAVRDYTSSYKTVGQQKRDVLLLWGKEDTEITPDMIKDIRSLIPRVIFEPIDGVGHGIVFQRPENVNRLVREFLSP